MPLPTFVAPPIVALGSGGHGFMHQEEANFERVGIAFMPCSIVGWGYLFAFVIATLALVFLAGAVWAFAGWQGDEVIQAAVLVAGVLATVRFARKRCT